MKSISCNYFILQLIFLFFISILLLFSFFVILWLCFSQVSHLVKTFGSLSGYLLECNTMPPLSDSGLDDGLMTPDSVLEPSGSNRTSSGSGGYIGIDCKTALACTATTEVVRKKRTGVITFRPPCRPACSPVSEISGSLMNRRKGTPHRAPLYWKTEAVIMREWRTRIGLNEKKKLLVFYNKYN